MRAADMPSTNHSFRRTRRAPSGLALGGGLGPCGALQVTHDAAEAVALADRVLALDGGRVALDLRVPLARPRRRADAAAAASLEREVLEKVSGAGG